VVAAVARHEFLTHLRRRSFLLTTALVPMLGLGLSLFVSLTGLALLGGAGLEVGSPKTGSAGGPRVGYVDPGGFVTRMPPGLVEGVLHAYADEAEGRRALRAGLVDVVYVLPEDYPSDASVVRIATGLAAIGDDRQLDRLLRASLWPQADEAILADLEDPGRRITTDHVPGYAGGRAERYGASPSRWAVPVAVGALLFSTIFMLSSFLLQSVTTEKESRVMEVLLTSVRPFHLLVGKLLGLGLLGLLQVSVWSLSSLVLLNVGSLAAFRHLAAGLGTLELLLTVAFFALGFVFYASLMASVGALAPSFQESGPLTLAVMAPAWLPILLLQPMLQDPGGGLARALSLVPLTSPLVMLLRVLSGSATPAEVVLSLLLLVGGAAGVLALAARLFQARLLLSGTLPTPTVVWRALRA
jgi:ABC-2 type transport system permease protein